MQVNGGAFLAVLLGMSIGMPGCSRSPAEVPPTPLQVAVSHPVEHEVTDFADYTGRTVAVDSVDVRAHVWGYLEQVHFKEGAIVQKGDVLFELDARPYQAALSQAIAKVAQDEAQLKFDEAEYQRNVPLAAKGAISQSDLDKSSAARAVDIANIAADKAVVASRQLDVDYTKVTAPISGRVSRYNVTVGNLVQSADQLGGTLLTSIVSVDPMYAYFDVDERTALRVRQLIREGKQDPVREGTHPVSLGLASDEGYPHAGTIDFVDNQVNPKTGTIRLRGVFPNKDQVLLPGLFVRVRSPIGRPHKALLVTERALDTDQGQKILYVVNDKHEVETRPVKLGDLHDGLREITEGLKPGEQVVVVGLQQMRSGMKVEPKLVDMPGLPAVAATAKPETP